MRIVIPTIGTRGDVQPFIALAQGLGRPGHRVTLRSHPIMSALVESHRVVFASMGPDVDLGREAAEIRDSSRNIMISLIRVMRFSFNMLERSHEDILAKCQESDLVVVPSNSAAGKNEADLLGLSAISANFMPWSIPVVGPERPLFKRLLYAATGRLIGLITTRPPNRMRQRQALAKKSGPRRALTRGCG